MRRAVLAVCVLVMAACSEPVDVSKPRRVDSAPSTTTTTKRETTTTSPSQFVVGDKVQSDTGNTLQVYEFVQPVPPDEFTQLDPDVQIAAIDVEACAGRDGDLSINPYFFELQLDDNTRAESAFGGKEPNLNHTELPIAGDCARGWVNFEVPAGKRATRVLFTAGNAPIRWVIS